MKNLKIQIGAAILLIAGLFLMAADHIEAPAVSGTSADITDFYCFQGESSSNLVFVANVQGLLSPMATADASFDENVLIEFNIDNDGDNVEDLVIQAIPRDGKMYVFGPVAPSTTGASSTVMTTATETSVDITSYNENANIGDENGIKVFAGPRDDPFFMDFTQYGAIVGGNATSFNDPGADTFAGSNVMSVVVEVPKSLLGTGATINTWLETKIK